MDGPTTDKSPRGLSPSVNKRDKSDGILTEGQKIAKGQHRTSEKTQAPNRKFAKFLPPVGRI